MESFRLAVEALRGPADGLVVLLAGEEAAAREEQRKHRKK
jgi:hypothetical protein